MTSVGALATLVACGNTSASSPDAPPLATHAYVIASVAESTKPGESPSYGLDLDGDGVVDNTVGWLTATEIVEMGQPTDSQAPLTAAIQRGDVILLADLDASGLTDSPTASLQMYTGADPQPAPCTDPTDPQTCGQHLQGTGTFDTAANSPTDTSMPGRIVGNHLVAGPGRALVALSLFDSSVFVVEVFGARLDLQTGADGSLGPGILGGAIPRSEIDGTMLPAIEIGVSNDIAADCTGSGPPDCGCTPDSIGAHWIYFADGDHDCQVTVSELGSCDLFQTLLAPDVTIDGQGMLSVGVEVTAVAATFTRP